MKTQLKSLLWAGFFMISMTQCQLCNNCIYKDFPPEVDLYFGFGEGRYWIYRNTTNGALDSLYVNSFFKTIGTDKEVFTDAAIDQNIASSNLGNVFYLNSVDYDSGRIRFCV